MRPVKRMGFIVLAGNGTKREMDEDERKDDDLARIQNLE
jgi:hypothetical protein